MAPISLWLADYQLLAAALLLGVMLALVALRQPAQRLAVAKSTLVSLAALALLCALPGWSLVHLLSEPAASPERLVFVTLPTEPVQRPVTRFIPTENIEAIPVVPPVDKIVVAPLAPVEPPAPSFHWSTWLVGAYAAGSAAVTLWLLVGAILAYRVRRQATAAPPELQELLRQICGGEKTVPELLLSPRIAAPAALGLRHPAILLPASTFPIPHSAFSISPSQLLPILAHEWAHLQHRDLHTLAASRLLLILLWPQPLFWLLRRTIRLDQETLADAAAADRAGRLDYAQQLLAWARTANTQRPPRLAGAVGLWEGPSQLKRRIALLLNEQFAVMRSCSSTWRRVCIASLAIAAVALSLVTLQPSPVAGEDETPLAASLIGKSTDKKAAAGAPDKSSLPVPEGFTEISGTIVTEDGKPATASGWLYSDSTTGMNSYTSAEGHFTDKFDAKVHNGTVWLTYFPDSFAPAWVGPFQAHGKDLNEVSLVLKPGVTIPIEVVDEAGAPVAGANISALPIIGDNSNGPNVERLTNDQGRYEFQHVAAVPYKIEVTAPTFQALRLPSVEMNAAQPLKLTLKRAKPASGVVENEDGTPAAGAQLRFRGEVRKNNINSGGPGYGPVAATTDAQGRFTLDSLAAGSSYFYVIETADVARAWSPEITAGMQDVAIRVPARRDLRGRVAGDVNKLPKRNGKPFVSVHQRHLFETKSSNYGDLVGEDAFITPTADGGEFTYEGLLPGEVELAAGDFKTTVAVNEQGVTEAVLQVAPKKDDENAAAKVDLMISYMGHRPTDNKTPNVLRGRCIDEANKPIADVDVELYRGKRPSGLQRLVSQTKTNAAGEFEFRDVVDPKQSFPDGVVPDRPMPNLPMFTITAMKKGRVSREVLADAPYAYREGRSVDVLMPPAASLSGIVKDAAGKPIAGARVSRNGLSDFPHIFSAMTDAEGRFSIDDLAPFDLEAEKKRQEAQKKATNAQLAAGAHAVLTYSLAPRFTVVHPEFSSGRLPLSSVPGNVEATLTPGARLRGRVLLTDGSPAASAAVIVKPSAPLQGNGEWGMIDYGKFDVERDYQATVQTDAEGRFDAGSLTPGKVDVWAELPGWLNAGVGGFEVQAGQTASLPDLALTKGGVIRLQLIDDETGRPIAVDQPLAANVSVIMKNKLGRQDAWPNRIKVSDQGVVEIASLPGTARVMLQSVEAGVEQQWVPAANDWKAYPQAQVVEGQTVDAEFRVRKTPQAGAAEDDKPQTSANDSPEKALVSRLSRTPNVFMGYCIDEQGQLLANVDVSLFVYESSASENVEPVARTKSAADGRFEFSQPIDVAKEYPNGVPEDHLAEPPIKIIAAVAQAPGRTTEFQNDSLHAFAKRGTAAILKMAPAQKLTGRVTDDKGQPVANAIVTATKQSGYVPGNLPARTDAEGRYVIDDLPSFDAAEQAREHAAARERNELWGMYPAPAVTLSVRHPAMAARRVNVKTIPGELNVTLIPGATIKGRVVARAPQAGDAPRPLGNVPVLIMRTRQPVVDANASYALVEQQQGKTDADGNYRFTSLPASEYAVTATAPNLTTVGVKGIEVGAGQTSTASDVVLSPGAILRIKLVDGATKEPLKLKAGQKGYVHPRRISSGSIEAPRMDSQLVTFTADAIGETRLAPGRYNLFVSIPGEGLAPNMESRSTDGNSTVEGSEIVEGKSTVEEFEVNEGVTLELDVPLISFPIRSESGVTVMVAPADAAEAAAKTQAVFPPATGHFVPFISPADGEQPDVVPLKTEPSEKRDLPVEGGADGSSSQPADNQPSVSTNAEAFSISGRCIDEAGQLVPNARLWLPLRPEFLDYGATLETVADDAGQFAFQIPAELRGSSAALQLSMIYAYEPAHAIGIASAYEQLRSGDLSAVEVTLPSSATTTYRILDPAGDPVADARVEPWHIPAGDIYPQALQRLLEVTSDVLGMVELRGMRESDIRSVRVHHAVWGAQEFSQLNNRRLASNNDLRLKLVGGIVGQVQTDESGPVAGIPVYASTEMELSQFRGEPTGYATTVTDADGHFEMPVIATGSGKLSFYVDKDQPWRVRPGGRFTVRADETVELNVPLERAIRAKGIVRTADTRAPVPHAQVHIRHGDLTGHLMTTEQTITDETGRFEAFVLPGEIRMFIQQKPAEFDPWECTEERRKTPIVVPNGSDAFDLPPIELERTKAVEGLIVDHNDQPLPNVRLYVTEPNHIYGNYIYGNTTSDEEGRFVMQLPPSVTVEHYAVRTNDWRDQHVLEVVSESPLKLRTPAPSVRQGAGNRANQNAE